MEFRCNVCWVQSRDESTKRCRYRRMKVLEEKLLLAFTNFGGVTFSAAVWCDVMWSTGFENIKVKTRAVKRRTVKVSSTVYVGHLFGMFLYVNVDIFQSDTPVRCAHFWTKVTTAVPTCAIIVKFCSAVSWTNRKGRVR